MSVVMPPDLPWQQSNGYITNANDEYLGHVYQAAEYIVRAANAFPALVAACEMALQVPQHVSTYSALVNALALARGETK